MTLSYFRICNVAMEMLIYLSNLQKSMSNSSAFTALRLSVLVHLNITFIFLVFIFHTRFTFYNLLIQTVLIQPSQTHPHTIGIAEFNVPLDTL